MKKWPALLGSVAAVLAIITFGLDLPEKISKITPKEDSSVKPSLASAQGRWLHGRLLLIKENNSEVPEAGIDLTLKETRDTGKTNSQGFFRIFLSEGFKAGERMTLLVDKSDWVIHTPFDGEFRVPENLKKEVISIRLLPFGSNRLLSDDRIEKLIQDAARNATKQVKAEGQPEKIGFSRFIRDWAVQYGFSALEAQEEINRWVSEVEKKQDNLFKLGLAAFAKKNFAKAARLFSEFAENKAKDLEKLEAEKSALTEETIRAFRKSGDAFYTNYNFEPALKAYTRALTYIEPEKRPRLWASVLIEIGNTNRALGIRVEGDASRHHLAEAEKSFRKALEFRTRKAFPKEWAMTQNNLGNVLRDRGIRTEGSTGKEFLREAVQAYRNVLAVYSQSPQEEDWAMTQNNLGNALWNQGTQSEEDGDRLLSEAVQAYRKALKFYTRSDFPQDWAMTQNNLGAALSDQGIRKKDKNEATLLLSKSAKAYHSALEVYTQEASPQQWAMTQNNLGVALSNQGTPTGVIEALKAYQSALEVRTRSDLPQDWAATQTNLGIALSKQGHHRDAVKAYRSALEVYTQRDFPQQWEVAELHLLQAYALLEDWPTVAERSAKLLQLSPDNEAFYQLAAFSLHERIFDFPQAFSLSEAWAKRHEGIEARIDFAEKHFTSGRFTEYEQRIGALFREPELVPQYKIPLQAIGIANAFALNKTEAAHGKADSIFEAIREQNKDFTITWSFEGTKQFIRQEKKLASQRDWLLRLFEALEGKNRDEILSRLKAVRADFQRLKAG